MKKAGKTPKRATTDATPSCH